MIKHDYKNNTSVNLPRTRIARIIAAEFHDTASLLLFGLMMGLLLAMLSYAGLIDGRPSLTVNHINHITSTPIEKHIGLESISKMRRGDRSA